MDQLQDENQDDKHFVAIFVHETDEDNAPTVIKLMSPSTHVDLANALA